MDEHIFDEYEHGINNIDWNSGYDQGFIDAVNRHRDEIADLEFIVRDLTTELQEMTNKYEALKVILDVRKSQ